jgi:hypothetical protein
MPKIRISTDDLAELLKQRLPADDAERVFKEIVTKLAPRRGPPRKTEVHLEVARKIDQVVDDVTWEEMPEAIDDDAEPRTLERIYKAQLPTLVAEATAFCAAAVIAELEAWDAERLQARQ